MRPGREHDQPPRIGLTTYRERASWGVWDEPADLLPVSYARAVESGGGVPLLLPPGSAESVDVVLDGLHGLLLSGGADVEPARYRQGRGEHTGQPRPDRDDWELLLVRAAIDRDLPVLAVCRGMQVLNVALGGDLVQHLPERVGHDGHCPTVGTHGRHAVLLDPAGRLSAVLGQRTDVSTYHHQAVDRLGADLVATGWTDDGTVEALELPGAGWVFGVQWHPEASGSRPLFAAFARACTDYRDRGAQPGVAGGRERRSG